MSAEEKINLQMMKLTNFCQTFLIWTADLETDERASGKFGVCP